LGCNPSIFVKPSCEEDECAGQARARRAVSWASDARQADRRASHCDRRNALLASARRFASAAAAGGASAAAAGGTPAAGRTARLTRGSAR